MPESNYERLFTGLIAPREQSEREIRDTIRDLQPWRIAAPTVYRFHLSLFLSLSILKKSAALERRSRRLAARGVTRDSLSRRNSNILVASLAKITRGLSFVTRGELLSTRRGSLRRHQDRKIPSEW